MKKRAWSYLAIVSLFVGACGVEPDDDGEETPRRDSGRPNAQVDSGAVVGPGRDGGGGGGPIEPGDEVDAGGQVAAGGEIPCAVSDILRRKCQTCHSSPTRLNAPMPLMTRADFLAVRPSGETAAAKAAVRIHSAASPMPPTTDPALTPAELSALDAWLDGTPARPSGETCQETPGESQTLNCEATHHFYAHANGNVNAPLAVPTTANEYMCAWFRSPFTPQQQAIGWGPHVDNAEHLHHYILYRTTRPPAGVTDGSVAPCNTSGGTFVMGWAPGKGATLLREDIGLRLSERTGTGGAQEWFYLQVHYWNPQSVAGQMDNSGVDVCVIDTPRPNVAAVLTMPGLGAAIPARATNAQWTGNCRPSFVAGRSELNFIGSGPHMHGLGTHFITEITRSGGARETLIELDTWSFDSQSSYPHDPEVRVRSGDSLRTTCTYANPSNRQVSFGERTEDEMCFNFALVYPATNLTSMTCSGF